MATEDDYGAAGHGIPPDEQWGPDGFSTPIGFMRTSDGLWMCCGCDERFWNRGEHTECEAGDYSYN